jgi:hypothetical protein
MARSREDRSVNKRPSWRAYRVFAALLLIPWPRSITVAAIAEPAGTHTLYARHDGRLLTDLSSRERAIRMKNDELSWEISDTRLHIEQLQKQIRALAMTGEGGGERRKLRVELSDARERLAALLKDAQDLTLSVPEGADLVWRNREVSRGQWVAAGTALARFRDDDRSGVQARLYLPARVAREVAPGQRVTFYSYQYGINLDLTLEAIAGAAAIWLEDPLLASINGGELAVQEEGRRLRLRDAWLQARAVSHEASLDLQDVAGQAKVDLPSRSLAQWLMEAVERVWHGNDWQ